MKNKEIEFSFKRSCISSYGDSSFYAVKNHYEEIFKQYFNSVFDIKKGKLSFYNLNIESGPDEWPDNKAKQSTKLYEILPYNINVKIEYDVTTKGDHQYTAFSFYFYNQNNCCGAMTISKTYICDLYRRHKLGEILQHFKEDLALAQGIGMLTCTDEYWNTYNPTFDPPVKELKPYRANTKLLLKTGWNVADLFFNKKSNNVVALFTKDLTKLNKIEQVTMKITKDSGELIKIENVTIGCDPELFFKSKDSGDFVPSFYVMQGDKHNPVAITTEGHNIQCDNVMAEYGIPPSKTVEEFVKHNLLVQDYLNEKIAKPNNLELVIFPYAEFKANDLMDDKAKQFGCEPDYNVYTGGKPNTVGRVNSLGRSAGKIVCQA